MEIKEEIRKALKSLPWYLVAGVIFFPVVGAVFTGGMTLVFYLLYFSGSPLAWASSLGAGLFVWVVRQFFRAVFFSWRRNHIVRY